MFPEIKQYECLAVYLLSSHPRIFTLFISFCTSDITEFCENSDAFILK